MKKEHIILNNLSIEELYIQIDKQIEASIIKYNELYLSAIKKNNESEKKLLTKKDAAKYLDISTVTLTKYIKLGYIKAHLLGGRLKFKQHELDNALKNIYQR